MKKNVLGAAGYRQSTLNHLLPDTVDHDIRNCMFTLVVELIDKLEIVSFGNEQIDEVAKLKSWRACSKDRTAAIKHISDKIGVFAAKKLNFAVANGEKVPDEWARDDYLVSLSAESMMLRWLACSLLPDFYQNCAKNEESFVVPESTTFQHFWAGCSENP